MCKIIAVSNQKGGVAKTTTTQAISVELASKGYKVLVVDGDQQANLSFAFGILKPDELNADIAHLILAEIRDLDYDVKDFIISLKEGVDLLPSSILLANVDLELMNAMNREYIIRSILDPVKDDYDYIIIDCPPSLGLITLNILTTSDSVLIPIDASAFSLTGMTQLVETITKVRKSTNKALVIEGVVFTRVNARANITKSLTEAVREKFGEYMYIFNTMIPYSVKAAEAISSNETITTYQPSSTVAIAYKELTNELLEKEGKRG